MRRFQVLALFAFLLLCAGCATTEQANNVPLDTQIANLERTQQQMQLQYNAMGETLNRLGTRIAELKARAARRAEAIATLPTPAPRADAPVAKPLPPVAAVQDKPTNLVVSGLTEDDMDVQAHDAARTAPSAPAVAAPAPAPVKTAEPAAPVTSTRGGKSYLVHVASYLDTSPIRPGWRQISTKNAEELRGLKPYVTPFVDTQERRWLRLSVGGFGTRAAAHTRCEALKAAGTWCDILEVNTSAMRELRG